MRMFSLSKRGFLAALLPVVASLSACPGEEEPLARLALTVRELPPAAQQVIATVDGVDLPCTLDPAQKYATCAEAQTERMLTAPQSYRISVLDRTTEEAPNWGCRLGPEHKDKWPGEQRQHEVVLDKDARRWCRITPKNTNPSEGEIQLDGKPFTEAQYFLDKNEKPEGPVFKLLAHGTKKAYVDIQSLLSPPMQCEDGDTSFCPLPINNAAILYVTFK